MPQQLTVELLSAAGVPAVKGKWKCFARLQVGATVAKSATRSSADPQWEQSFTFPVLSAADVVEVSLLHKQLIGKDTELCTFQLSDLTSFPQHRTLLSLRAHSTTLRLALTPVGFGLPQKVLDDFRKQETVARTDLRATQQTAFQHIYTIRAGEIVELLFELETVDRSDRVNAERDECAHILRLLRQSYQLLLQQLLAFENNCRHTLTTEESQEMAALRASVAETRFLAGMEAQRASVLADAVLSNEQWRTAEMQEWAELYDTHFRLVAAITLADCIQEEFRSRELLLDQYQQEQNLLMNQWVEGQHQARLDSLVRQEASVRRPISIAALFIPAQRFHHLHTTLIALGEATERLAITYLEADTSTPLFHTLNASKLRHSLLDEETQARYLVVNSDTMSFAALLETHRRGIEFFTMQQRSLILMDEANSHVALKRAEARGWDSLLDGFRAMPCETPKRQGSEQPAAGRSDTPSPIIDGPPIPSEPLPTHVVAHGDINLAEPSKLISIVGVPSHVLTHGYISVAEHTQVPCGALPTHVLALGYINVAEPPEVPCGTLPTHVLALGYINVVEPPEVPCGTLPTHVLALGYINVAEPPEVPCGALPTHVLALGYINVAEPPEVPCCPLATHLLALGYINMAGLSQMAMDLQTQEHRNRQNLLLESQLSHDHLHCAVVASSFESVADACVDEWGEQWSILWVQSVQQRQKVMEGEEQQERSQWETDALSTLASVVSEGRGPVELLIAQQSQVWDDYLLGCIQLSAEYLLEATTAFHLHTFPFFLLPLLDLHLLALRSLALLTRHTVALEECGKLEAIGSLWTDHLHQVTIRRLAETEQIEEQERASASTEEHTLRHKLMHLRDHHIPEQVLLTCYLKADSVAKLIHQDSKQVAVAFDCNFLDLQEAIESAFGQRLLLFHTPVLSTARGSVNSPRVISSVMHHRTPSKYITLTSKNYQAFLSLFEVPLLADPAPCMCPLYCRPLFNGLNAPPSKTTSSGTFPSKRLQSLYTHLAHLEGRPETKKLDPKQLERQQHRLYAAPLGRILDRSARSESDLKARQRYKHVSRRSLTEEDEEFIARFFYDPLEEKEALTLMLEDKYAAVESPSLQLTMEEEEESSNRLSYFAAEHRKQVLQDSAVAILGLPAAPKKISQQMLNESVARLHVQRSRKPKLVTLEELDRHL
eukprot:NODE_44_length_3791_cov_20.801310_g40_i0.p1 GENE.NODE_44_length_3791_cov_20.801310_g40_i0~~NODE_44_length_3791_cov_20.801310_g40_i0.p1  ORF type:complete len:1177 (+),score=254.44 NODE_44_length_3791_cov_20.801310_g40_i0:72-3602(+)